MIVKTIDRVRVGGTTLKRRRSVPPQSVAVGARVDSLRLAKGWTKRELARRTGLNEDMVCRLTTGQHPGTLNAWTLAALSDALDVTMDWLWRGDK